MKALIKSKLKKEERGVALFMAIFALLLLSAIAVGFVFMANTETSINSNYKSSQQAYFAAKAGLEEARARIMTGGNITPPNAMPNTTTAKVIYVINPLGSETVAPWDSSNAYFDNTLCKANYVGFGLTNTAGASCAATTPTGSTWYSSVASTLPGVGTANAFPVKWTRIALKANRTSSPKTIDGSGNPIYPFSVVAGSTSNDIQVCWTGTNQILLPAGYTDCMTPPVNGTEYRPVYFMTSLAVSPTGSRRILNMEVADDPPFYSNAAVNSQDYVTLNGQLTVDGYDYCSCDCSTSVSKSGKTVVDCSVRVPKAPFTSCRSDKYAIYSNSAVDTPSKSETLTAGTTPVYAQNQPTKSDLDSLINKYRNMAGTVDATLAPYNYSCTGTPKDCGLHNSASFGVPPTMPPDPPNAPAGAGQVKQVTYVPGSLKITAGSQGNGVLVVDGDLEINGGLQYYGLIIVRGIIKFTGGGSDTTNIYGGVMAGQSSIDNVVLGGSAVIKYNRCALESNNTAQPPRMLNVRELQF